MAFSLTRRRSVAQNEPHGVSPEGGEYTRRQPLNATGPDSALSTGTIGFPAGALSGASYGIQTLNVAQSAHLWRFSAAKCAAGGAQDPDYTVTLPLWTQPWLMRVFPSSAATVR